MKLTANQRARILQLLIVFLVAVSVGTGISAVLAAPAQQTTGGWATYLLQSGTSSITADTQTTGRAIADYGTADCYQTVDVTSAQNVTTTLQHSADSSNWVNGQVLTAQTADGTIEHTTPITGSYIRANIDLMNSNAVTVTLRCIAKDRSN